MDSPPEVDSREVDSPPEVDSLLVGGSQLLFPAKDSPPEGGSRARAGAGAGAGTGAGECSWTGVGTGEGSRPGIGTGEGSWPGVGTGEGSRAGVGAEPGSFHCKEVGVPVLCCASVVEEYTKRPWLHFISNAQSL